MIHIPIHRYISSAVDTAPWTFTFYDAENLGCVSFVPQSSTTSTNEVETLATFTTADCYENSSIRLHVVGANGCKTDIPIELPPNPCSLIEVSTSVSFNGPLIQVTATTNTNDINFHWSSPDNTLILQGSATNPTATFQYNPANPNLTPTVYLQVNHKIYGCDQTIPVAINLPTIDVQNHVSTLLCNSITGVQNRVINLSDLTNGPYIDWSTVEIISSSSWIDVEILPGGYIRLTTNDATVNSSDLTGEVQWRVYNIYGVPSPIASVTVESPICSLGPPNIAYAVPTMIYIPCDAVPGDTLTINAAEIFVDPLNVQWSTLTFTSNQSALAIAPNLTFSPNTQLIEYVIPNSAALDNFSFYVYDTNNNMSSMATVLINLTCNVAPTTVGDTECANCGESVEINVLGNDTPGSGAINPQSVEIVTPPSHGTATVLQSGNIIYSANFLYGGTDTFTYRVANNMVPPTYSEPATVTLTVLCAGQNTSLIICN